MFEDIFGHDLQKKLLEKSICEKNISHAYLFDGKKGIGKATIAKKYAMGILGTDNLDNNPDFKYIGKKDEKKDIIVEQIREELIDDVYLAPAASDFKVYIIDDAEYLNVASQNALLKILEEPPQYVVIILISSNVSTFLPTIISRLNKISFSRLDDDIINTYINQKFGVKLDNDILKFLDGSLGTAIELIQKDLISKFSDIKNLYIKVKEDAVDALIFAGSIDFTILDMLDYFEFLLYSDSCYNCIKFVEKAKQRLSNNGNYDIVVDNMILKIVDQILR